MQAKHQGVAEAFAWAELWFVPGISQRTPSTKGIAEALAWAELWLVLGISQRTPSTKGMQRRGFRTLDSVRLSGRPGFRAPVSSEIVKHTLVIVNFLLFKLSLT